MIAVRFDEVMHTLREEASTIKLWLARVANHLECAEPHGEHASIFNKAKIFGSYSPIHRSSSLSVWDYLVVACTPNDSCYVRMHVQTLRPCCR